MLTKYHVPDRALITDANASQFGDALAHPESLVTWIVMDSDDANGESRIWTTLRNRTDWQSHFSLRKSFTTAGAVTEIYERIVTPPIAPSSALFTGPPPGIRTEARQNAKPSGRPIGVRTKASRSRRRTAP